METHRTNMSLVYQSTGAEHSKAIHLATLATDKRKKATQWVASRLK